MSIRRVITWLVIDYWRSSMSNRWVIEAHRLLSCTRKTLFFLSCTILFRLWFFYLCLMHFSLCLKFLLTAMSRRKVLITDDSQNTGREPAILQLKYCESQLYRKKGTSCFIPSIGWQNFRIGRKWPFMPCTKTGSIHRMELLKNCKTEQPWRAIAKYVCSHGHEMI